MWPCGKDLIQQTRSWWGISMLFRHYPSISSAPSSWPSFLYCIYLCLSLRFNSPALLQTNGTKNSGNKCLCCFLGLAKEGEYPEAGGYGAEWQMIQVVPACDIIQHRITPPEKRHLFSIFFWISLITFEGSV